MGEGGEKSDRVREVVLKIPGKDREAFGKKRLYRPESVRTALLLPVIN